MVVDGRTARLAETSATGELLEALLLPGLVNAHAHLDLAGGDPVPSSGSFPDWLLGVGAVRQSAEAVEQRAADQAAGLARRGVVAIGDIDATSGRGSAGRLAAGVAGLAYLEIVGVRATGARQSLARALDVLDRGGGGEAFGLSPHAPYSVHAQVLPEIVRAARRRRLRLAMHLAESEEETRFLLHGDGPFVGFLETIGKGSPFEAPPGLRPIAYADRCGLLEAGGVVIHGNDLDDDDVERLGRRRACVVYCHGTHRHFDRPPHRALDLLAAGARLALGTDSGISNDGVDLFGELIRVSRDRPDIDPGVLLEAASLGGRVALGLPQQPARFEPGSAADGFLVRDPPSGARSGRALLEWALSGSAEVHATVHSGRMITGSALAPARTASLDSPRPRR